MKSYWSKSPLNLLSWAPTHLLLGTLALFGITHTCHTSYTFHNWPPHPGNTRPHSTIRRTTTHQVSAQANSFPNNYVKLLVCSEHIFLSLRSLGIPILYSLWKCILIVGVHICPTTKLGNLRAMLCFIHLVSTYP